MLYRCHICRLDLAIDPTTAKLATLLEEKPPKNKAGFKNDRN